MTCYSIPYLKELEAESIYVIREVAAQFEKPIILFSGGKDSIVLTYLAIKAFWPAKIPFPLLHIDTGHNFHETIEFRDRFSKNIGVPVIVRKVEDTIKEGKAVEEKGYNASRNALQTITLLDTIREFGFDAAIGGGRRDEEKARAKERFFSYRNEFGEWDPKNQRPELWNLFNGRKRYGEHFRIFPLSNWTELDIWHYIHLEKLDLPKIYFSHKRLCVERNGIILAYSPYITLIPGEEPKEMIVRCRTVGDMTCTGLILSKASNTEEIIEEIKNSCIGERGLRADDRRSDSAMEERKVRGYF